MDWVLILKAIGSGVLVALVLTVVAILAIRGVDHK